MFTFLHQGAAVVAAVCGFAASVRRTMLGKALFQGGCIRESLRLEVWWPMSCMAHPGILGALFFAVREECNEAWKA